VLPNEIKSICSALDKLDKLPKDKVRLECLEKGICEDVWMHVDEFISAEQPIPLYLQTDYLTPYLHWDSSLVRGLDYYTGLIFEVVVKSGDQIATIAAGGRYDNLFETLGGRPRQCVGFSIGLDRFLQFYNPSDIQKKSVCIGLISRGEDLLNYAKGILREMREQTEISSQIIPIVKNDFKKQLKWALDHNMTTHIVWIGANEMMGNKIRVKDLNLKTENDMTISEFISLL
jgi:histidyl-tRNA synthetase